MIVKFTQLTGLLLHFLEFQVLLMVDLFQIHLASDVPHANRLWLDVHWQAKDQGNF